MRKGSLKKESRYILLGILVDVSASMKQSLENQQDFNGNGFRAFRSSLRALSQKVKQEIKERYNEGIYIFIEVFAQAFGLKAIGNCDFLTLMEFSDLLAESDEQIAQRKSYTIEDPYEELKSIARENGLKYVSEFSEWIKKEVLPEPTRATILAVRLRKYPRFANMLSALMPSDLGEAWRIIKANQLRSAELGFFDNVQAFLYDPENKGAQLGQAKKLVGEIADAYSDEEVRKIVIREVGDQLEEELSKRGNRRKPLEKVADLLKDSQFYKKIPIIWMDLEN